MSGKREFSIKTSIRLFVYLINIFAIVLVSIVLILITNKSSMSNINASCRTTLESTAGYINLEIDNLMRRSSSIVTDSKLINLLSRKLSGSMEEGVSVHKEISDIVNYQSYVMSDYVQFEVYTDNSTLYKGKSLYDISYLEEQITAMFYPDDMSYICWGTDDNISFYRKISGKNHNSILKANIPMEKILYYIEKAQNENYVISLKKHIDNSSLMQVELMCNRYLCADLKGDVEEKIFYHNLKFILFFVLCAMILIAIATEFVINRFNANLSSFINSLVAENDGSILCNGDINTYVEFADVKGKMLNLLNTIRDLIGKKNELELELLQTRINPHLLYNSMSVIKWNIMRGKKNEAMNLINVLSDYYRKALGSGSVKVPFTEEVDLIRQYVKLMEISQEIKIALILDIGEEMNSFMFIKHSLQPFVENSILHGLKNKEKPHIIIRAHCEQGKVHIKVIDNGCGIEQSKIDKINSGNYDSMYQNYGIRNTKQRLQFFYGAENCSVDIFSEQSKGTEVSIVIEESMPPGISDGYRVKK